MEDFTAYEREMKKNPPSRYNTKPAEVVEQIGLEACQPVKTAGAALTEEDGHGTQEEAIEKVKEKRASAKHRLKTKEWATTKLLSGQQTRLLQGSAWKDSSQVQYMTGFQAHQVDILL